MPRLPTDIKAEAAYSAYQDSLAARSRELAALEQGLIRTDGLYSVFSENASPDIKASWGNAAATESTIEFETNGRARLTNIIKIASKMLWKDSNDLQQGVHSLNSLLESMKEAE